LDGLWRPQLGRDVESRSMVSSRSKARPSPSVGRGRSWASWAVAARVGAVGPGVWPVRWVRGFTGDFDGFALV